MTRADITALADDQLRNMLAERVMGWTRSPLGGWLVDFERDGRPMKRYVHRWDPTRDIADAWRVVEKLADRFWCRVSTQMDHDEPVCYAGFIALGCTGFNGRPDYEVAASSPARAICLAALMAVEDIES